MVLRKTAKINRTEQRNNQNSNAVNTGDLGILSAENTATGGFSQTIGGEWYINVIRCKDLTAKAIMGIMNVNDKSFQADFLAFPVQFM